jgi:hypothetical protein
MDDLRHVHRLPLTVHRDCSLAVIAFRDLRWTDHSAYIVDISTDGVGVVADDRIEPGFVWFRDRVAGHKGGVLTWAKKMGDQYRAGIRFIPLSHDVELRLRHKAEMLGSAEPHRDPVEIISTLVESLKKGKG